MSGPHRIAPIVAVTGTSLMVGCGSNYPYYYYGGSCGSYGSYGSYGACAGPPYVYPPGIYAGSLSDRTAPQGHKVISIIATNGNARMSAGGDSYYRLKFDRTGRNLSGTFTAYSQSGMLPDGTKTISGSISGVTTPSTVNATLSGPGSMQQSLAVMPYDTRRSGSSLTSLAGNWTGTADGLTLTATIQPDGSFVAVDSNNCAYEGGFGLIDPRFNAYTESHTRTCHGVGAKFSGLAAFVPGSGAGVTGTPAQIEVLTDSDAGEYLVAALQ